MTREEQLARKRELEWRAEDDARIMAQYQELMNDKKRVQRAIKVAEKQANELQKRTNIMKKVANKGKTKPKK